MTLMIMTQAADANADQPHPRHSGRLDAPPPDAVPLDSRRRRILFRATHRGMHEADVLLGGYVAPRLAAMTDAELGELEPILDMVDADLVDWMLGRVAVPAHADTTLLRAILAAAHQRGTP